jgi:hypothetical protein
MIFAVIVRSQGSLNPMKLDLLTGCLITNGSLFQGSTAQPLDHLAGKLDELWKAPVFVYNISLVWVIFRETVSG